MSDQILQNILSESIAAFKSYKKLAERSIEQVSDKQFFELIDPEANSIALIVKHVGGNLLSRWTDFLTADGEKPGRDRDSEFNETETDTRESLMNAWEKGWEAVLGTLQSLTTEDLGKKIYIRTEEFTVVRAIYRSLVHTAYHTGQITLLAKHFCSANWKNLSVPKNKSGEFNAYLAAKEDKGNYLEASHDFAKKLENEQ